MILGECGVRILKHCFFLFQYTEIENKFFMIFREISLKKKGDVLIFNFRERSYKIF